jgi:steroid 5-alpha reductase family enzyme
LFVSCEHVIIYQLVLFCALCHFIKIQFIWLTLCIYAFSSQSLICLFSCEIFAFNMIYSLFLCAFYSFICGRSCIMTIIWSSTGTYIVFSLNVLYKKHLKEKDGLWANIYALLLLLMWHARLALHFYIKKIQSNWNYMLPHVSESLR